MCLLIESSHSLSKRHILTCISLHSLRWPSKRCVRLLLFSSFSDPLIPSLPVYFSSDMNFCMAFHVYFAVPFKRCSWRQTKSRKKVSIALQWLWGLTNSPRFDMPSFLDVVLWFESKCNILPRFIKQATWVSSLDLLSDPSSLHMSLSRIFRFWKVFCRTNCYVAFFGKFQAPNDNGNKGRQTHLWHLITASFRHSSFTHLSLNLGLYLW